MKEKDVIACAYENCDGDMDSEITYIENDNGKFQQRVWTCVKCKGKIYGGLIKKAEFK